MNTNGANTTENRNYGAYCYDFSGTQDPKINNDYLELMQAYTSTGTSNPKTIPTNKFCGVFDGLLYTFPGITSKKLWFA